MGCQPTDIGEVHIMEETTKKRKIYSNKDCIYYEYKHLYNGTTGLCHNPDIKKGNWSGSAGESDCTYFKCDYKITSGNQLIQTKLEFT